MDVMNSGHKYEKIRIRYSSIINYLSFIYRMIISIGFSTLVIRRLPIEEYGLFTLLFAIYGLFVPIISLWMFWTYRTYVRVGVNEIVKTGHFLGYVYAIFSGFLVILFVSNIPYVNILSRYDIVSFFVIIFSTEVFRVLYQVYTTLILGYRPYIVGYTSLIIETIRFVSAYIFVYLLRMKLFGAVLSVFVTFFVGYITLVYFMLRAKLPWPGFDVNLNAIKLFVKNAYIPLTNIIRIQIESSGEKLLTGIISASPIYPAYLGIASVTRRVIAGGGKPLIQSLSPSLLRKPNKKDIEDILRLTIIIVSFMIGIIVSYAKTIVSLFNPLYLNGIVLFITYSFVPTILIIVNILYTIGISADRSDLYKSGLGLYKSTLFKNNLILMLGSIIRFTIGVLSFIVFYLIFKFTDVNVLLIFPISSIAVYLAISYILYKESKKVVQYSLPFREIIVSLIGICGIYVSSILTGLNDCIIIRISRDYPCLVLIIVKSIMIYLIIQYILSPWFRSFITKGYRLYIARKIKSVLQIL